MHTSTAGQGSAYVHHARMASLAPPSPLALGGHDRRHLELLQDERRFSLRQGDPARDAARATERESDLVDVRNRGIESSQILLTRSA